MAQWLQTKTDIKPLVGIICGSGLGNLGELVQNKTILAYDEIPDFPRSTGKNIFQLIA
jgi:purine-nucleoside phosphorylase